MKVTTLCSSLAHTATIHNDIHQQQIKQLIEFKFYNTDKLPIPKFVIFSFKINK